MRHSELLRRLESVPAFPRPRADLEQLVTPAAAAAAMLRLADRWDGLAGRSVLDLGCGTGRLAIGAALLGAGRVRGIDVDAAAVEQARAAAEAAGVAVTFEVAAVDAVDGSTELVLMNPPFGAQKRHADRPFWAAAFRLAGRSVYAFALRASRTFIARETVARSAHVLEVAPVPWVLGRSLPHHRRKGVDLDVDLWALRKDGPDDRPPAA